MARLRMHRWLIVLGLVVIGGGCGRGLRTASSSDIIDTRLPKTPPPSAPRALRLPSVARPTAYRLELVVNPDSDRFAGRASIKVQLDEESSAIWLHGKGLRMTSAIVRLEDGSGRAARYTEVRADGLAVLETRDPIPAGELELELEYDAAFGNALEGLYKVQDGGGSYAFTQFEATAARAAFPCFDEPSFKAPIELSLVVPEGLVAVSSAPETSRERLQRGERLRFDPTPPIPTYLLAFAVGPFDVVERPPLASSDVRDRSLPIRGITGRGRGPLIASALDRVGPILNALEDYFGTGYPYPKLDLLAVPDFAAGAMENVGLIAFRETYVLLGADPPDWQERALAHVLAHELSHMWFGNLVTMSFWDDLWLNEGFATWMTHRVLAEVHPEMRPDIAEIGSIHSAMGADSLRSARRVRQPIANEHDIRNAFDAITYRKGAGLLRMVEQFVGPEAFQAGVRAYLDRHRDGNATSADLFSALSAAAEIDLAPVMTSFLDQAGVPMVEARVDCGGSVAKLHLRQERYRPLGFGEGRSSPTWTIPICVRYGARGSALRACGVLDGDEGIIDLPEVSCPSWVMPNSGAAGYYRFALEPESLEGLNRFGSRYLTTEERLAVVDSVVARFDQGLLPYRALQAHLAPLAASRERALATSPMGPLAFVVENVVAESELPNARASLRRLYQGRVRTLGFAPRRSGREDQETRLLRAEVLGFLARVGRDGSVRAQLLRRARTFLGVGGDGQLHPEAIDPGLRGIALVVAGEDGGETVFDAMERTFVGTSDALLRTQLLRGLGSATDEALAARARALALDPRVRLNEAAVPLFAQVERKETRDATFEWLAENWDPLVQRLGTGRSAYLVRLGSRYCAPADRRRVETFFSPRVESLTGGPRELAATLETIERCAARAEAHRQDVAEFFGG